MAKMQKIINDCVKRVRDNYRLLRPRYNDFCIELIEEIFDNDTGQKTTLSIYVPTLYLKPSKTKLTRLSNLLGLSYICLIDDDCVYHKGRKFALEFRIPQKKPSKTDGGEIRGRR